jgi:hypothetical protein
VLNKQQATARVLILEGLADAHLADDDRQTPAQAAAEVGGIGGALHTEVTLCAAVLQLREGARATGGRPTAKHLKAALAAAGVSLQGGSERTELEKACEGVMSGMPAVLDGARSGVPAAVVETLRAHLTGALVVCNASMCARCLH